MSRVYLIAILITILFGSSCQKRPDPIDNSNSKTGTVKLIFENKVGAKTLVLETGKYINENGDTFKVNSYAYYISNISLVGTDNIETKENESYHLINEKESATKSFTISGLQYGQYNKIKFLIGVDSTRNVSGSQTGDLDPMKSMFWDWKTGYIMAKIEGESPQADTNSNNLVMHIAGFKGVNNVLKWVELSLPKTITLSENSVPEIHIVNDMNEWFKTPVTIKFSELHFVVSEGVKAKTIADNYADMFSIDHVD